MHRRLIEISRVETAEHVKTLAEKYGNMPLDMVFQELQRQLSKKEKPRPISFQTLSFKNGLAEVPDDWIYIETDNPNDADFACAISVKEGTYSLNAPKFVTFLKHHPYELSDKEYRAVEERCIAKSSSFKDVFDKEVFYAEDGKYKDNHGNIKTIDDFKDAPKVGIFLIDENVRGTGLTYDCKVYYRDAATIARLKNMIG